jgi:cytochrome c oxidase assembly factor 1
MQSTRRAQSILCNSFFALPASARTAVWGSQFIHSNNQYLAIPHRHATTSAQPEPFLAAPREGSGPLLSRSANRDLPDINTTRNKWLYTLPLFLLGVTGTAFAFFNYQKASSSTVSSILYALRTSPTARDLLGDEIYFASQVPWISGQMNQLHGNIEIEFWVKGSRAQGQTRFVARRRNKQGAFQTEEWSLKMGDGTVVHLLSEAGEGGKPEVHQVVE